MAFTVDHAKRMRAAYQARRQTAPCRSAISGFRSGQFTDAVNFLKPELWAKSPRFMRTCTATRRTANRSGRAPSIPI